MPTLLPVGKTLNQIQEGFRVLNFPPTLLALGLGFVLSVVPAHAETVDPPDVKDQTKNGWYLDLTLLGNMGNLAIGHDYGRTCLEGGLYGAVETGNIGGYDLTAIIKEPLNWS